MIPLLRDENILESARTRADRQIFGRTYWITFCGCGTGLARYVALSPQLVEVHWFGSTRENSQATYLSRGADRAQTFGACHITLRINRAPELPSSALAPNKAAPDAGSKRSNAAAKFLVRGACVATRRTHVSFGTEWRADQRPPSHWRS